MYLYTPHAFLRDNGQWTEQADNNNNILYYFTFTIYIEAVSGGRSSALKAANIFGSLLFCDGRRSISSQLETVRSPSTRFIVRVHQEYKS